MISVIENKTFTVYKNKTTFRTFKLFIGYIKWKVIYADIILQVLQNKVILFLSH